ncbi:MAG TPA: ribosome rescue protein RqcH [Thermoplasmata archaeon]|nr:ribosome rescue protein RqcH [Thermoplasmata archaeon]
MPGAPTPKDRFTSLDILAVVHELRAMSRVRVDKVFDLPSGGWSLVLRVPREGRRELLVVPGRFAALLGSAVDHADALSPFARELRRLLEGAVLEEVPNPGGERLLEVLFRRAGEPEPIRVALELFGTGNLVVARGGTIAAAAHSHRWAHRTVAVGAEYARPPSRTDPWTSSEAEIEAELARSHTDVASTLAARLSLGGPIAEELVVRCGWDGSQPAAVAAPKLSRPLYAELQRLISEVGDHPTGRLYLRGGVSVDATPYASLRWADVEDVVEASRPTFSEAAFEYFAPLLAPSESPEEAEAARARRELERQVDRQRKAVEGLAQAVDTLQSQAAAIFEHFAEAEAAIARAASEEEGELRVEVPLGELRVPLYRDRPVRESAQALYEEAKRAQSKLAGAKVALEEAQGRLVRPIPRKEPGPASPRTARSKSHWFEQYRWFVSSEGVIVIAGRDATSNDQVVKRHLKEGDLYVHADLHGAASVVVKHPPPGSPPLTDATIREAGQWAVGFSKAWRAGLASASAFWVAHDQVSKAGASGEFVARGAWMVHGTKHTLRDLPTELALGTVDYEGESRWTVAPPEALRSRGQVRVLLTPGDDRLRAEREVELSKDLGIPRPLLQSLLPAGGLTVRRP